MRTAPTKPIYEGVIRTHNEDDLRLMVAHLKEFFFLAGMRNEIIAVKISFEKPSNGEGKK